MNTEQERAEFEAWAKGRGMTLHKASPCDGSPPYYLDTASIAAWEAYQAGRAALQSQDRDDSQWCADDVREFRCIGNAINRAATDLPENWGIRISLELGAGTVYLSAPDGTETMIDMSGEAFSDQISAAIDHARRVEGVGNELA